jgi:integrase
LLKEVQRSRCNAFAKGSFSNLRTQFRSYFAFCVYFGRNPLPADSKTIYTYVQFLSRSLTPASVRNYLSGVKMLHIFLGLPFAHNEDFLLQLELRGISRLHPHVPIRAKPITPNILLTFHQLMDNSSLHLAVWSCCLILFYTMARVGSILPSTRSTPRGEFLTRDRINFCEEGLLVTLLHTKTIQFGRRRLHIPLLKVDSILCPVAAFARSIEHFSVFTHTPAFVFLERGEIKWLTPSIFIRVFRDVLGSGGHDASFFTGHSFRRGGATWAFQCGMPGELIQICGDWVSDSYRRYLEFSTNNKLELAALLTNNLPC